MFKDQQTTPTSRFTSEKHVNGKSGSGLEYIRRRIKSEGNNSAKELRETFVNGSSSPSRLSPFLNDTTMVAGGSFDRAVHDHPRDLVSRRDTARKNLMGHLYSRQPALKRSYSFVAGERPSTETLLPQLHRREKRSAQSFNSERQIKPVRNSVTLNGREQRVYQPDKSSGQRNGLVESSAKKGPEKPTHGNTTRGRIGSHQVSLPELINDINMSSRLPSPGDSDGEDSNSEREQDVSLEVVRQMDMKPSNPVQIKAVRYRPITPGVIENLNKLKVSSKSRTQQWVKMLPVDYRAAYSEPDDGHLDPSDHTSREKEWIYTAT